MDSCVCVTGLARRTPETDPASPTSSASAELESHPYFAGAHDRTTFVGSVQGEVSRHA